MGFALSPQRAPKGKQDRRKRPWPLLFIAWRGAVMGLCLSQTWKEKVQVVAESAVPPLLVHVRPRAHVCPRGGGGRELLWDRPCR